MKKIIDFNSIKTRLLLTLVAVGMLPVVFVAFIGFRSFETTLIDEIGSNRSDVLSQIGDRVKQVKNNAYTLSNLYYYDQTLLDAIKILNEVEMNHSFEDIKSHLDTVTAQYKNSLYGNNLDFEVVLYTESGFRYVSRPVSEVYDYMSPLTKIWYRDMLEAGGEIIDVPSYKDKITGISYFSVARAIMDQAGNPLAYLMININERQIYQMYEAVISNESIIYIVDNEGTIISSNQERLNGFNYFNMKNLKQLFGMEVYTITRMRNQRILFTMYEEINSAFTVLEEISLISLLEPIRRVRITIVLAALGTVLAAALYAYHFADKTTKPVKQLCDFMQQVEEENLDQGCQVSGYTEINILSDKLNLMLVRMKELLNNIKQKEKQKHKMELGFLQAQINPHFMYNTLFSVKCMVDMQRNEEASQMLTSFIQILRSTLSNPDEFVTLQHEFMVLKQYVDIQKFRYDNQFEIIFQCDTEVEDKKIPRLLIQPLLENAIFHGVELRKKDGLIIVTAEKSGADILITVEDNGIGISPEMVQKVLSGNLSGDKAHIGLYNVKERIQLNFGKRYGVDIISHHWKGTKVILTLPIVG